MLLGSLIATYCDHAWVRIPASFAICQAEFVEFQPASSMRTQFLEKKWQFSTIAACVVCKSLQQKQTETENSCCKMLQDVARCCKMLQAGNEPILRQHLLLPLRSRSSKSAILSACLQNPITIIIAQYWSQSLSGDSLNMVEHLQEANFRKFSKSASVPSVL